MRRPSGVGLAASACLLVADAAWLVVTRPPAGLWLSLWFILAAAVGCFLPGLANQVSMVRAHLAGPGLVFALSPRSFGPLVVVVALAALTDVLDGTIARRWEGVSRLGGALDPLVDGVFFGAVAIGLAAGAAFPGWLAAVVVARYLLPALVGGVLLLSDRRPQLRHTPLGQVSTTLIALLLGGTGLVRALGRDTGALLPVFEVLIPLAALATFGNLLWVNRSSFGSVGGSRRAPGG